MNCLPNYAMNPSPSSSWPRFPHQPSPILNRTNDFGLPAYHILSLQHSSFYGYRSPLSLQSVVGQLSDLVSLPRLFPPSLHPTTPHLYPYSGYLSRPVPRYGFATNLCNGQNHSRLPQNSGPYVSGRSFYPSGSSVPEGTTSHQQPLGDYRKAYDGNKIALIPKRTEPGRRTRGPQSGHSGRPNVVIASKNDSPSDYPVWNPFTSTPHQKANSSKPFPSATSTSSSSSVGVPSANRKFICSVCSRAFTRKSNLQRHHLLHTGERPFVCPICGVTFTQIANLNYHQRIHSKEKPFKCYYCWRTFRSTSHAKRHVRLHTGEKPYPCKSCPHLFSSWDQQQRHIRHKHQDTLVPPQQK